MSPQYQNLLVLLYLCRDIWLTVLNKIGLKVGLKELVTHHQNTILQVLNTQSGI